MKSESKRNREFSDDLRKHNALVLPIVGSMMQPSGWPDRFICHRDFMGFVEGKQDDQTPDELQTIRLRELNERQPLSAFIIYWGSQGEMSTAQWYCADDSQWHSARFDGSASQFLGLVRYLKYVRSINIERL